MSAVDVTLFPDPAATYGVRVYDHITATGGAVAVVSFPRDEGHTVIDFHAPDPASFRRLAAALNEAADQLEATRAEGQEGA